MFKMQRVYVSSYSVSGDGATGPSLYGAELFVAGDGEPANAGTTTYDDGIGASEWKVSSFDGKGDAHSAEMASPDTNDVAHEQRGTWVEPMIFDSATPTGNTTPDAMDDFML